MLCNDLLAKDEIEKVNSCTEMELIFCEKKKNIRIEDFKNSYLREVFPERGNIII